MMNPHLTEEMLLGYVQRTLTDARREAIDQHLTACPACRARLDEHETWQCRLRNELRADLKAAHPSAKMAFSAVAPQLRQQQLPAGLWRHPARLLPGAAALAGLVLALLGLRHSLGSLIGATNAEAAAPLPTLACFLFTIPVLTNYQESKLLHPRHILTGMLTFLLWIGTAVVGLYEIFLLREIFLRIYVRFWREYWTSVALASWGVFLLGSVWIAIFIGGGEYHYRHLGKSNSWQRFGWTIGGELFILLLAYVF